MSSDAGAVTVTGADGFIGRNLCLRLQERDYDVVRITRSSSQAELREAVERSEWLISRRRQAMPTASCKMHRCNSGWGCTDTALRIAIQAAGSLPLRNRGEFPCAIVRSSCPLSA